MTQRDMTAELVDDFTDGITLFFLCEAEFPGGTLRFWSGYGVLSWNGNDYTGTGELLQLMPPKETKLMESAGAVFELSCSDPAIISAALTADYHDRLCRIYIGSWDNDTNTVVPDPYLEFEGRMNTMPIKKGGDACIIQLTAEDELVILQRNRERRRTPEDQKINYPDDKGFDLVAGLQKKKVPWGLKS